MENILDEYAKKPISKELYKSIAWWEKRRLDFNILVGISGVAPIFFVWFSSGMTKMFFENLLFLFIGIFVYAFFANLCFCFGWAIDVLKSYYYESPTYGKSKSVIFFLGVLFSMIITLIFSFGFAVGFAVDGS